MLTLNVAGKYGNEVVEFVKNSLKTDENELKIIIDDPFQASGIKNFLETQGFDDIIPEDDDGILCLLASKKSDLNANSEIEIEAEKSKSEFENENLKSENSILKNENENENENEKIKSAQNIQPAKVQVSDVVVKNSTGILISCENKKHPNFFLMKFIISLTKSKIKPTVIAIMNNAVKTAVYDSHTCDYLKQLENDGVKILISDSCADRLGITEAVGVGILTDMSEILEEIFMCEKVVSI